MRDKKIIIFDLDGTLVDSAENISRAINFVRHDSELPPLDKDFITTNINRDDINPAMLFYGVESFTSRHKELFEGYYMDICIENICYYEHIPEVLMKFKSFDYALSVATNGTSGFAKKILSSLNLDAMFDQFVGSDMVSSPKPSPDMLHLILDNYGYSNNHYAPFLVGDSIKDVKSAKNAGIKSAFARWGFGDDVDGADEHLSSADELERLMAYFN